MDVKINVRGLFLDGFPLTLIGKNIGGANA
jgi:hypothetical protein